MLKHLRKVTWRCDRFGLYCLVWQDGELVAGWSLQWSSLIHGNPYIKPGYNCYEPIEEVVMKRELYVDGHSITEGVFVSCDNDGTCVAPFVVFDADAQQTIAGPFYTWTAANEHRLCILGGAKPELDARRLRLWVDQLEKEK